MGAAAAVDITAIDLLEKRFVLRRYSCQVGIEGQKVWALCFIPALGLVLIIMGVIGSGMLMLGYKVTIGGRHKLQLKCVGIEFAMETSAVYFSIVLGLVLVCVCTNSEYFGQIAEVNAAQAAILATTTLEEGGYRIREEEEWIDLRDRKQIGVTAFYAGDVSETERRRRIVLKDVKSGVKEVNFRHATSGPGIVLLNCEPKGARWRKIASESRDVLCNPFTHLLRGREIFQDLLARKGKMQSYYMSVPITDGSGQEIWYRLKYYNSFQGADFEWAGRPVSADTDIIIIHIIFPEDKPFKDYETSKKTATGEMVSLPCPETEIRRDNRALTWKIRHAKKGEVYVIKWSW